MVEIIAVGVIVVLLLLGVFLAIPRYIGRIDGEWPDILAELERVAGWWLTKPRLWDIALGVLTLIILAVAVAIYQDAAIVGDITDSVEFVAHTLGIIGMIGLFATSYLSVRRSGLHSAEATLIGSTLAGVVLLAMISAMLVS